MPIRTKLVIIFLALIIVPMSFMAYLEFSRATGDLEAVEHSKLESIASLKMAKIEDYFNNLKGDLRIAQDYWNIKTNLPLVIKYGNNKTSPVYLKAKNALDSQLITLARVKNCQDIMLLDPEGKIVYCTSARHWAAEEGKPIDDPKIVEKGGNGFYVSEIYRSVLHDGQFSMMAAGPAIDGSGKTIGVIVFEIDMEPIYAFIQDTTGLGKTGETLIVKKTGDSVLFLNRLRHDPSAALVRQVKIGSTLAIPAQQSAMGKDGEGMVKDYRGKEVLAVWRYLSSMGWGMVVKLDVAEAHAPVADLGRLTMFFLLATSLMGVFVALSAAKSISRPIDALQKGAKIIGSGNLDYKVGTNTMDEVGQLSRAIDQMAHNLKTTLASRDDLNREVAERRQLEDKLIVAKELAESANQAKSEFLANMSHELRTPLNSIIGFSEVLQDQKFGPLNEKQADYLNDVLTSGRHLLSLINDILDLSKIEAGKMTLAPADLDLKILLEQSLTLIKEKALKHNLELSVEIGEGVGVIKADERKIKQIIYNLLSNASKFTPDGGKIGIKAVKRESEIEVAVWDTGIGISTEDQPKIFNEFTQIENAYTKKHQGTGLGLVIAKRMVELHGGKIRVESGGAGKGSAFKFTLPVG